MYHVLNMKKGEHVHVSTTVCPMHGSYMDLEKLLIKNISILVFNFTRKITYSTFILFTRDKKESKSESKCTILMIVYIVFNYQLVTVHVEGALHFYIKFICFDR